MAKAAELDSGLVAGLKLAKNARVYFALVLKGPNDGKLILSKTKVPRTAVNDAKKQCGGSTVLKGFCRYDEDTHVFETAKEAPATASQAVRAVAKRDAGSAIKAEFRISTDPELLADEAEAPAVVGQAAPPQTADGADFGRAGRS
jgi:hypothetical protein